MSRRHTVAAVGLLLAVLAGCSGGSEAETGSGGAGSTTSPSANADPQACGYGEANDADAEVTLGEISAASDEWSEYLGQEWRHYLPVAVTNETDAPCLFSVNVRAEVNGEDRGYDEMWIPLLPGQTYHGQLFDMEKVVDFSADAEDATPAAEVQTTVNTRKRPLLVDYYDMDSDVRGVSGEGADATLRLDVTVNGTVEDMPGRTGTATKDNLYVVGLNASGEPITIAFQKTDPIPDGETKTFEIPVGGGYSGGDMRTSVPAATYDEVASWEVYLEPELNQDSKVG